MSGYRIDDLLADTAGAPRDTSRVNRRTQSGGYDVTDLLDGDTSLVEPPKPPPGRAPSAVISEAPTGLPGLGRAIMGKVRGIGDFLAEVGQYGPGPEQLSGTTAARYEEPEETRRLTRPPDRRTPAEKYASARASLNAGIGAPSDATRVAPAGSPVAAAEQARVKAGLARKETDERNFTPKNLRDLASRGDAHADELFRKADEMAPVDAAASAALRASAEDAKARASNAEIVADDLENADTFGEIARSSLLGVIHDPNAPAKRNLAEYAADPSLSFTPEEQTRDLGKNLPVGRERGFDLAKDITAPLVGSLPLYVAGGVAGRAATRAIAGGLEALNAPRAATIARALAEEIETRGLYGPKQAGLAGLREAGANFAENLPRLAARGATEGQVVGAVQAAREAQQMGGDPVQAAAMSTIMNVPFGIAGEVGLGAAARAFGVADRSIAGALDRVREKVDAWRDARRPPIEPIGATTPPPAEAVAAMDQGAAVAGKLPVSDKTLEGQRVELAKALEQALAQKQEAPNFGSDVGLIERDRAALTPMRGEEEPNVPLRSARDVGLERAGVTPEDPLASVDANVQMRRAAEEAQLREAEMAREAEQLRLEQAAQARDAAAMGPKTLGETIAEAGQARDAGEPLAAEYHDAISKFADVQARMADAGDAPSAKLKLDYARARSVLNEARRKYGTQVGAAAVLGLASHDGDLSDEEKKWLGIGGVALAATTSVVKHMPRELVERTLAALDAAPPMVQSRASWMEYLSREGVVLGDHYSAVDNALRQLEDRPDEHGIVAGDGNPIHRNDVVDIIERFAGPHTVALARNEPIPARFTSRLARAVETLEKQRDPATGEWKGGKKWDEPRPAADWLGKLKGMNTFSRAELALVEPRLKELQASKTKIDRAGVLALVEDAAPRIEQVTYGEQPRAEGTRFDPDAGEDVDIEDMRQLGPDRGRDVLQAQMDARGTELRRLEAYIEERTEEARREMDDADSNLTRAHDRLTEHAREHWPNDDWEAGVTAATEYLREHVEAEYIPRGAVDTAFQRAMEEGNLYTIEEPYEPEMFDLDVTENDDGTWTVTHQGSDLSWTEPTSGEALARANLHGAYPWGGETPMLPENFTVREEERPIRPKWRAERRDGTLVQEGYIDRLGMSEEAMRARARALWGEDVVIRDVTPTEPQKVWVIENGIPKDQEGHESFTSAPGEDRATFVQDIIERRFDPPNSEEDLSDLRGYIDDYADRLSEYNRAESEHYWMTEGEAFDEEQRNIERYQEEIDEIEGMMDDAPDEAALPEATGEGEGVFDPYTAPVPRKIAGSSKFSSYQRIGGGAEYAEHLNVWENNPGQKYTGGHWGTPDTVSHIRMETHPVEVTPGLSGERVEYIAGEPEPARVVRSQIDEKRQQRAALEQKLAEIARQYEALPADEQTGLTANSLANEYNATANQIKTLADRETELAGKLRGILGVREPAQRVRVVIESQSDLAQDAGRYGVRRTATPEERAAYERAIAPLQAEQQRILDENEAVEDELVGHRVEWRRARAEAIDADINDALHFEDIGDVWDYLPGNLDPETRARELARLRGIDPRLATIAEEYVAPAERRIAVQRRMAEIDNQIGEARDRFNVLNNPSGVPESPFVETKVAHALNAARGLMDAADGGYDVFAWSDGPNRVRNAHLPIAAATLTYDQLFPSAVKAMLAGLGFKNVKLDHIYIRGFGHWKIDLTPEMRAAIRKHGMPVLGVLAALALSSNDAEAQGMGAGPKTASLYGTGVGGMAAGGLIVGMMANRKLRALVKENRELARALHLDDLSGLANKRALSRAIESVDHDPATGWIVLDGNRFKALNDAHGHPEGDKAIAHFGKVVRDAAAKLDVPMRGFRAGGDEFAFAAPKAKIAEVMQAIEKASPYTKGDVTTSLTGAWGDTFAEADALLNAQKEAARKADPSLRRPGEMRLYSNPIGPALAELRRAPGVAGLAVIGTLASQYDENEYIRRMGLPILAIAAMNAIGSRRIGAGIDNLADGIVKQLRKTPTGTSVARAFNPDRLLSPEVRAAIRQFERARAKATAVASRAAQKAKALGPEGDRAVSDVLDREAWEGMAAQTPEVLTVALELADEYDKATKAQLAAGTLAPESVIPNYGGPRKYAFYEVAHALADKPGKGGGPGPSPRIAKTQTRTLDIPIRNAERALAEAHAGGDPVAIKEAQEALDLAEYESAAKRVERGEIREASYRAAAGIEKAYQNVASAKLFETLRATPGVAHPEWVRAVDDYQTATSLLRTAEKSGVQSDIDAANLMVGDATSRLDDLKRRYQQKGQDYKALPDSPSWGMLRGAIVQRDVAHSLEGFGSNDLYGKALRAWKEVHTVFNVGTHIGNIVSNVVALHMGEVPAWVQPLYYKRALADLKSYGEAAQALTEAGIMHVNATTAEGQTGATSASMRSAEGLGDLLPTTRPETADVIRRESEQNSQYAITEPAIAKRAKQRLAKGAAIGGVIGAAKGYDDENPERVGIGAAIGAGLGALAASGKGDVIRRLYGHEDNIARMAIFLRRRALGDTKEEALQYAIDGLADFRTRSPALRVTSRYLSPFILYQAKAVPSFAAKIIDHPYKWLSLVAMWGALNEMSKKEVGEIPEEDRDERDRATWGYFFPGLTQLPITNAEGDKGATDIARYTPLGGLATGAPPGSVPDALSPNAPQVASPGGPLIDLALRAANVHPMTKRPLLSRDAPPSETIHTLLQEITDFGLPSSLGYHVRQLTEDYDNQDWEKMKNDLLGPLGTKPRFVRQGAPQDRADYEYSTRMREIQYLRNKALDANKNPKRDSIINKRFDDLEDAADAAYERRAYPPAKGARP